MPADHTSPYALRAEIMAKADAAAPSRQFETNLERLAIRPAFLVYSGRCKKAECLKEWTLAGLP